MFQWIRKQWSELKKAEPGHRFQELHKRRQASRKSPFRRRLGLVIAIVVVLAGIAMMPLPGPGWPIVFVGAGLLARESSHAARALDWLEVKIRSLLTWGCLRWRCTPFALKFTFVAIAVTIIGAGVWMLFSLTSLPDRVRTLLT